VPPPRRQGRGAAWLALVLLAASPSVRGADFTITPASVTLQGNFARTQLVVTARDGGPPERAADWTRRARYASSDAGVVTVDTGGVLLARGNGLTSVSVTVGGASQVVPVTVSGVRARPVVGFGEHVLPILSKAGCNAGACHASQFGKGGLKLSVFASAPEDDYRALVRDALGRRVDVNDPAASLMLLKPTLGVPHGGGRRLVPGSVDWQVLAAWQAGGAPGPDPKEPHVRALHVWPARRVGPVGLTQQLRAVADYDDGSSRDVTAWARFNSTDEGVLRVGPTGLVETVGRGQGVALVRFEDHAEIAAFVVPHAGPVDLSGWEDRNFIDRLAALQFREAGISPSPLCDDATFLRRAYLGVTGTLPTPEQAAAFLDAKDPGKRDRLIDELLGLTGDPARDVHGNDYAAWWALKWADLLRCTSAVLGEQGMWAMHNWLMASFRENKPFDRFVRELLTARGPTFSSGPANYFRIAQGPQDLTEATAQVFLGVRVQCARCHHHPFERISQADYYALAAFFARVGTKGSQEHGIFGNETVVLVRPDGEVGHPKTGQVLRPTPLHGKPLTSEPADRRAALADWMTAPDNPYFARNVVNRYWAALMGRGLVEPVDDVRATNPPSNPALLDALAKDFVAHDHDVKHLVRTILRSRLYQLSARPTHDNAADARLFSHHAVQHPAAEALLDAVDRATGVPTKFPKVPLGTRAIELPDARYENYFLSTFGKPRREVVCECERVSAPNLAQALHTLNGDVVSTKVAAPRGRVARLLAARRPHEAVVEELYLATLSRRPMPAEQDACRRLLAQAPDAKTFYEDLLWSLINSEQFLFVH
jgi:hypothetical protein